MNQNPPSLVLPSIGAVWLPAPPRLRMKRRRISAWGISGVIHGLLLAVAFWGGLKIVETPPPTIRLVFVEPPPPPPAPLGAPTATGVAPIPDQPPAVVEKPLEQIQPKQKTPERRKIVKPAKTREPIPTPPTPPQQDAVPEAAPAAGVVEARAGVAAGTMNGDNQGVIGGVAGGHAGGIIGGHGIIQGYSVSSFKCKPL